MPTRQEIFSATRRTVVLAAGRRDYQYFAVPSRCREPQARSGIPGKADLPEQQNTKQ